VKFWNPTIDDTAQLILRAESLNPKLCIDVGGNHNRFPLATETVGWEGDRHVNLEHEPLPYDDQSVDFLYCRHTIEDLGNPEFLLSEIRRVAKAGYIETPSPVAELTRGIDSGGTHLGYIHHRWIAFHYNGAFTLLPKYPVAERLPIVDHWNKLADSPEHWSTRHFFTEPLNYRVLKHELDFQLAAYDERNINAIYLDLLHFAIDKHFEHHRTIASN